MTTARTLITQALKDLGAIAVGETPTADEAQDALEALNQMVQVWQTEAMVVYAKSQQVFTYPTTGQQSYTIGPTGNFVTTRPIRIDAAYNRDRNDNDYLLYVAKDFTDYSNLVTKNVTANLVTVIYYDPTYPNGTIYNWPTPNDSSYRLVMWTWTSVTEFTTLDTVIVLPPGYEEALRTNLAVRLSPRYGREVMPALAQMANESKAQIKRTNMTIPTMSFELGIGTRGATFNYLTGNPT